MSVNWESLKAEVRIENNDVNAALLTQTDLFIKYASQITSAETKLQQAKFNLERVEGIRKESIRRDFNTRGDKITEARLNDLVTQDSEYRGALEDYLTAASTNMEFKLLLQAIVMRKDMLISLSANQRTEAQVGIQQTFDPNQQLSKGLENLKNRMTRNDD